LLGIGNLLEDQTTHAGRCAPVAGETLENDPALGPLLELIGPGPDRMPVEMLAPLLGGGRRDDGHREHGQVGGKGRELAIDDDANAQLASRLHAQDVLVRRTPREAQAARVLAVKLMPWIELAEK